MRGRYGLSIQNKPPAPKGYCRKDLSPEGCRISNCEFRHVDNAYRDVCKEIWEEGKFCHQFIRTSCRFGDRCRDIHSERLRKLFHESFAEKSRKRDRSPSPNYESLKTLPDPFDLAEFAAAYANYEDSEQEEGEIEGEIEGEWKGEDSGEPIKKAKRDTRETELQELRNELKKISEKLDQNRLYTKRKIDTLTELVKSFINGFSAAKEKN